MERMTRSKKKAIVKRKIIRHLSEAYGVPKDAAGEVFKRILESIEQEEGIDFIGHLIWEIVEKEKNKEKKNEPKLEEVLRIGKRGGGNYPRNLEMTWRAFTQKKVPDEQKIKDTIEEQEYKWLKGIVERYGGSSKKSIEMIAKEVYGKPGEERSIEEMIGEEKYKKLVETVKEISANMSVKVPYTTMHKAFLNVRGDEIREELMKKIEEVKEDAGD